MDEHILIYVNLFTQMNGRLRIVDAERPVQPAARRGRSYEAARASKAGRSLRARVSTMR